MSYTKIPENYPFIEFPLEEGEIVKQMYTIPGIFEIPIDIKATYFITNYGKIFSYILNKLYTRELFIDKDGYLGITFSKMHNLYRVHRLVMFYFGGPIPENYKELHINHKDFNKQNNHIDNLEWCTCQYNVRYNYIEGYIKRDLSNELILAISDELLKNELSMPQIAEKFGVSVGQVGHIKAGRFPDVTRDVKYVKRKLLSNEEIIEIYNKLETGNYIFEDLAKEYNISKPTIYNISKLNGDIYRELLHDKKPLYFNTNYTNKKYI